MKQDSELRNNLKSMRTRLGMSQQELANLARVTRQTISGAESGQYAPSVAIALRLAKVLGCQVEDLFWFEQDLLEIEAVLAKSISCSQQQPVSLARIGGQWIAYPHCKAQTTVLHLAAERGAVEDIELEEVVIAG